MRPKFSITQNYAGPKSITRKIFRVKGTYSSLGWNMAYFDPIFVIFKNAQYHNCLFELRFAQTSHSSYIYAGVIYKPGWIQIREIAN